MVQLRAEELAGARYPSPQEREAQPYASLTGGHGKSQLGVKVTVQQAVQGAAARPGVDQTKRAQAA